MLRVLLHANLVLKIRITATKEEPRHALFVLRVGLLLRQGVPNVKPVVQGRLATDANHAR